MRPHDRDRLLPTFEDVERAAAAGDPKALGELDSALERRAFLERAEDSHPAADELPELEGDRLAFEWDFEDREPGGDCMTVIRLDGRELWREVAYYEGADRFDEVKALLKDRYGARFASLIPTRASELYLYGDMISRTVSPD